jgi:predicted Zn finger-like uncharacterized protein
MFTICPKCALTLVVTAADLRVAQGHVRCGRCSSVFNALARLTEERQVAAPEPSASSPAPSPPVAPLPAGPFPVEPDSDAQPASPAVTSTAAPPDVASGEIALTEEAAPSGESTAAASVEAIPEEALEFNPATTNAESVFVQPRPDPQWEAATGSFKAMVAANQEPLLPTEPDGLVEVEIDSGFLAQIIRADAREAAPAPVPAPASPSPAQASTAAPTRTALDAEVHPRTALEREPAPEPVRVLPRVTVHEPEPEPEPLADDADEQDDAGRPAPRPPYAWIFGIAGAAVVLIAQIVNHYRETLAASARFNHPLTAVYRTLGVTLKPRWDLHAYDVRQLGASVDPANAGQITVRASIKNAGPQPQPLPLLRVTLQDRFGTPLAARDVQPQFYVPGAVPAAALLGAGQRIDAEMAFLDPGASAVGFELDACLPASGGGIACANDAAR